MSISQKESHVPALQSSKRLIRRNDEGFCLSLYDGAKAEPVEIAQAMTKLKIAFPKMDVAFFDVLAEAIDDCDFTTERLRDAVKHVLYNFRYKELNVADIVSYDRRVKLYTGAEFMNAQMQGIHRSKFEKRDIDGEIFFVLKSDLIKAGIK
jgi:hypothetical protein